MNEWDAEHWNTEVEQMQHALELQELGEVEPEQTQQALALEEPGESEVGQMPPNLALEAPRDAKPFQTQQALALQGPEEAEVDQPRESMADCSDADSLEEGELPEDAGESNSTGVVQRRLSTRDISRVDFLRNEIDAVEDIRYRKGKLLRRHRKRAAEARKELRELGVEPPS
jgi:hypothetical protein